MDGLIRKRNDRRPRSRTVDVVTKKEQLETHTVRTQKKRREEQAACTAAAASIRPSHSLPSSLRHQPQRLLLLLPSLSLSAHTRTVRVPVGPTGDGTQRERKDPSRAKANHHRPGKRIGKGASSRAAQDIATIKQQRDEKRSPSIALQFYFLRQIFDSLSSPPHHRPITASSSVARRRRPAGGTSQRRQAGVIPRARSEANRATRRAFFNNNSGGGGGDGVVQGARAPRDAVPPGGRVARLGGHRALRGRPARLPPPRLEPRRRQRRRRQAAAPRALRRRGGRLPRHVHRGAILHAPPHLRARGRGQPGAPQRPRARRHAAHVLPPRRTRAHLPEHQVPAPDGGCAVPGIGDGIYSGVPALLLPLNNSPGTGRILPLPPGPAHWSLRRLQRPWRAPPGELPC